MKTARGILTDHVTRVDPEAIHRLAGALDVPVGALWRQVGLRPISVGHCRRGWEGDWRRDGWDSAVDR